MNSSAATWIFPLGDGDVTSAWAPSRPTSTRLMSTFVNSQHYTDQQREEWELDGELRATWSAMLPMGGAVSGVARPNWMLVGDQLDASTPSMAKASITGSRPATSPHNFRPDVDDRFLDPLANDFAREVRSRSPSLSDWPGS